MRDIEIIEEIKKNKVILIFSFLMIIGFKFFFYQKDKSKYKGVNLIDKEKGVEVYVKNTELNRTELFINDSLIIQSGLVIKSNKPDWLQKKSSRNDYVNYSFSDIPEPYKLFKQAGSEDVFIIKNGDSLRFSLSDLD